MKTQGISFLLSGHSSPATSRADAGDTDGISGLGEVWSVVHTGLYHSTDALLVTRGRHAQNTKL